MDDLSWLEPLRGDLIRRGLPPGYVTRLIRELEDHRADLAERGRAAGPGADGPLGRPGDLADLIVAQYRARSAFGRHPVLTFLIAPAPLVMTAWLLGQGLAVVALNALGGQVPAGASAVGRLAWFVPPVLAAVLFCRLSWRCGRGWAWSCATCGVLVVLTATFRSTLTMPAGAGTGTWVVGFGPPSGLFPALLPMAVGGLLAWHLGETCVARSLARLSLARR